MNVTISFSRREVIWKTVFAGFLALTLLVGIGFGQSVTGDFSGTILDVDGAAIAEAKITLRSADGKTYTSESDSAGSFIFKALPVGEYQLVAAKVGFVDLIQKVSFNGRERSEVTMQIGNISENVTIVMSGTETAVDSTLKLGTTLHQTPRSVTAISDARIREQNFRQVSDVLSYVPGTTQNSYRNGSYHFYARGYRMSAEDTKLDGMSGINVGSGGFGASMFGIEQVVVLRGPAGLLYGAAGSPGGMINLVSKKPQEEYSTRVDLRAGGYAGNGLRLNSAPQYGVDIDSTGAVFKNKGVLYRGMASIENMNYFTNSTLDRNRYVNGSLVFKLDKDGRFLLTPSVQYTRYHRPYGGGIVASPTTSLRTNDGRSTINTADMSSPNVNLFDGRRIEETGWAGLDFKGVLTEKLLLTAAYRYISFDTDINSFTPQATTNAQITALQNQFVISRVQARSTTDRNYHNANADASYEAISNNRIRTTMQIGFYERAMYSRANTFTGTILGAQSPVNIYTGAVSSPVRDTLTQMNYGVWGLDKSWNGYFQNRTALDNGRWNFVFGLNYGQVSPVTGAVRKSDLMPNASLVFSVNDAIAVYGSYSTSFNPTDPDLEDADGNRGRFGSTIGKNYEIGAKYDLPNRRVSLAAALFHSTIENALVQSDIGVINSRGNRYYIPAGTRRSKGAELTGSIQVTSDLSIDGGVSFLDAIYKGFPSTADVSSSPLPNSRAEKSPRWSYNLYTRYSKNGGKFAGLGGSVGLIYQGTRLGSNGAQTFAAPDPLWLPSYTRIDVSGFYRLNKHMSFAVSIENLFDTLIFVNASVGSAMEIAAPRSATFKTSFNF